MYPAPGIIERIGPDWDWIWLDGQHGQIAGYSEMLALVRACDLINRPAFVRVPGHDPSWIGLALDMGASAVIVPQVETPESAEAAVRASKFPPLGDRSYGGRRPIDREGRLYSDNADKRTRLICQIESPTALKNAEKIAAVPGVDALFLGPDDLLLRQGISMDIPRSRELLAEALQIVTTACQLHEKESVTVAVGEEMLAFASSLGFHYLVTGGDVSFLANASRDTALAARTAVSTSNSDSVSGNFQPIETVY